MERARQGKHRYRIAKFLHEEEAKQKQKKTKKKKKPGIALDKAAIIIQSLVRGYLARQRVKKIREEELELLGLRFSTPSDQTLRGRHAIKCKRDLEDLERFHERRRIMRRRNQKAYEEAQITIHNRLRLLEGPEMAERFKYQLRTWLLFVKETTGKLPTILKADFGGSRFDICPNQLPEEVYERGREATDPEYAKKKEEQRKKEKEKEKKEKAKNKAASDKKKKKNGNKNSQNMDNPIQLDETRLANVEYNPKEKAKKKDKDKGRSKSFQQFIHSIDPPSHLDEMAYAGVEYNKMWRGRDESHNPDQRHEEKFIIKEKRQLLGEEVRNQVDDLIRDELKILKQSLEGKKGGKKGKGKKGEGKKGKGKGKGKGKSKGKGKGKGKKKKKKKGKDLTPDRSMESLFQELLDNNIVRRYPEVRLDSLVGSCSLINGEIRSYFAQFTTMHAALDAKRNEEQPMPGDQNPLPSFGDVKRAIKDIAILPMGNELVHELSPHCKSLLIVGPEGSGKGTLIDAICTELHATMFDLTAANIAGKYQGKDGMKMLLHLLEKVGHAVSPLVIKIDNCEKTYMKKVPKTDKTEPKRLKKKLGKMLKSFQPGDQRILIGTSSEPWLCPLKALKKDYQKIIYIPRPDYGTRMDLWRHFIVPYASYMHSDVHFSLLTKLSDGWTGGAIKTAVTNVVTQHENQLKKDEQFRKAQLEEEEEESYTKRISSIGRKLIRMDQFLDELSKLDPVFLEQDKAWTNWFNKTPFMKARLSTQYGVVTKKPKKGKSKGKGKKK